MQISEVGSLLEEVAVDLVEGGGLVAVEEGVGVGQIEESVVSEGQGARFAWILAPTFHFLRIQPHRFEYCAVDDALQAHQCKYTQPYKHHDQHYPANISFLYLHTNPICNE